MKCELCHKVDAEVAIRKDVEGEEQELYVCRGCAHDVKVTEKDSGKPEQTAGEKRNQMPEGISEVPFIGMILDATFEVVGRALQVSEPSCPECGITRAEYRKASRMGCPACYQAFESELDSAIFDMHRTVQHVGKAPSNMAVSWQVQQLQNELDDAVKHQRYEEAIALRDRIKKLLEGRDEPAEGERGLC